jgi:subtilase family serine protease
MKTFLTKTPVILLAFILSVTISGVFPPAVMATVAGNGADLVIQEISTYPAEPELGEQITITVAVKNQGDTKASPTLLTCYMDDAILDTESVGQLQPGITSTVTFTWIATGGTHTVRATADVNGELPEADETNNTGTYSLTTLAADLVVQNITWSPANPSRGDSISISIIIQNQGTFKSKYSNLNFLIDGASRGIIEVAPMDPGSTLTKTVTWITLSGEHIFTAIIDEANTTKESNEDNNESSMTFNTMAPDLGVKGISWTPEFPSKGDTVSIKVTVTNQGAGRADASSLGYFIDDAFRDTAEIPDLNAGASSNVTFTWSAIPGAHKIRVVLDYYRTITETNESNNELETSIATQSPDLLISDLSWTPDQVAAGDQVTFTVTLKNQGNGNAEASTTIFYIDSKFVGSLDFAPLAAGEEETTSVIWTAEGGSHYINLVADNLNKIIESNEGNNQYSTHLVAALPDLIVSDISFSPEKPALNDTITITITVKNQGQGAALKSRIACNLDGQRETIDMISALGSGKSAVTTYQCRIQSGHHVFQALADFDDNIREANEKNNSYTINIAPNMPDLAIANVSWSPADIVPGQEITFSIVVENTGGVDAGASRIVFYTDDTISGYNDIEPIKAGEKFNCTFTWAASEGKHTIKIAVDSKGQITEIDENNNTVTISIPPPDLTVQDITFSPPNYVTGDTVTVKARIVNLKGNKTPGSTAIIYIDDFGTDTLEVPALAAGEGYDFSFAWTADADAHTFRICADTGNTVMETDETNNTAEAISATTIPDLAVDSIGWVIDNHLDSHEVTFTVLIKNSGACESGAFALKYSFDNGPETIKEMTSIPGGGTGELVFTTILATGAHSGDITLDIKEEISEADETNNHHAFVFSTIAPDLVIHSISWGPSDAKIGDNVTISVKLENLGLSKAVNTKVSLTIDGAEAGIIDVPQVDTGGEVKLDFSWKAAEGEHTIKIMADASQAIAECNETNNTRERTIIFTKPEPKAKPIPVINAAPTTDGGLLETWWWLLLVIGGLLGMAMIYSTVRNMRKR